MPSLMLRGVPADLVARLRAYARSHNRSLPSAAIDLLTIALDHLDARAAGGRRSHAQLTPAERSARARALVQARWAKRRDQHPPSE